MTSRFEGLAEIRARFYFQDILAWIRGLYDALRSISSAIASLKKEFDSSVPRSRLNLSSKCRQEYGPTSLQWAELKLLGSSKNSLGAPRKPKVFGGLSGKFDPNWVYHIARRHDLLPRFLEFNDRVVAINGARAAVFRAIRFLQFSRALRYGGGDSPGLVASALTPDSSREVPAFPADRVAPDFPANFRRFLKGGWIAAFTLGLAEEEFNELALEVSRNPSADGIRLDLAERSDSSFIRQLRWDHEASRTIFPKLTHVRMKRLRIREGVRPVLTQKELKRARINERFAKYGSALDKLRRRCTDAQSAVSSGLAEAKTILLLGRPPQEPPSLPAAG